MQIAVTASPLKYLADFFDKMCLAKGLYMRLTAGISNSSVALLPLVNTVLQPSLTI